MDGEHGVEMNEGGGSGKASKRHHGSLVDAL